MYNTQILRFMNYSKILIAGLAGVAIAVVLRKILKKEREFFDDILFDSEFIPGFKKALPLQNFENELRHFQHRKPTGEDAESPMFI